ncbi:hypothetical protein GLOIN_2v1781861 [Rhizophagus irregularis DAOM 181602=DAOM 197198]|nr:hypothetical protein GLOIN_2v1781861 [Rhizophagus irregularis DAOM 181602=DAOM 197198]
MWKFSQLSAKKFKEIRYTMTDNNDRDGRTDSDELLAINDIGDYWPTSPPKKHIHVIVKLPLLSLEEALSCIPPPITYSPDCVTSKTTTKAVGDPPASVQLWDDFFDKVNSFHFDQQPRFERPRFVMKETAYIQGDLLTLPAYQTSTVIS